MALLLLLIGAAYALDRPTSRFQNAFGNRGSSVRRKRTLPVYRPPDSPATPLQQGLQSFNEDAPIGDEVPLGHLITL